MVIHLQCTPSPIPSVKKGKFGNPTNICESHMMTQKNVGQCFLYDDSIAKWPHKVTLADFNLIPFIAFKAIKVIKTYYLLN